jgi:hypothetical protein
MELQGPEQFQDPWAKDILRFNRGGIVSNFSELPTLLLFTLLRLYRLVTIENPVFLPRRNGEM